MRNSTSGDGAGDEERWDQDHGSDGAGSLGTGSVMVQGLRWERWGLAIESVMVMVQEQEVIAVKPTKVVGSATTQSRFFGAQSVLG